MRRNDVDIKFIPFEICLILKYIRIQIHKLRKILIIHINDTSDSSYHSLKFTVLVVVAIAKKNTETRK